MPSRRVVAAAVAVAVIAIVAVVLATRTPAPPNLGTAHLATYEITYKQSYANSVRYEDLSVHRPYDASDLTSGTGPVSTEQALYDQRAPNDVILVGGREPGPPSGDQDLVTQLPEILSRHLATDLHRSQKIAGRTCHLLRFLEPPSGPIKPLKGNDHDDMCLASGGLVLSERWTIKGNVAYTRVATKISREATPMPSVAGATVPSGQGAATARVVEKPQSFLASPSAPSGWHARPVIELAIPSPDGSGAIALASVVWAFSHGARTLFVEAGGPSGQLAWHDGDTVTRPLRLAHLGTATTAIRSDGAEIRVALSRGRWVRVRGTVPLRELVRYADALRVAG